MSTLRSLTAPVMNPKTPPSTPFLEKGPHSNSKRAKHVHGAVYRHPAQGSSLLYTRFLYVVIIILLCCLAGLWRLHNHPNSVFALPWSTSTDSVDYADYERDIIQQLRTCRLDIDAGSALCIENIDGILTPMNPTSLFQGQTSSPLLSSSSLLSLDSLNEKEKKAWIEMKEGLERLWTGLVESECSCKNAEALDRTYEGLKERARWMGTGGVRED